MAKTGPHRGTKQFNQKGFTQNFLSLMKGQEQAIECCTPDPPSLIDIQIFGSPTQAGVFQWNKPDSAKMVLVQMFGGGSAGQSGTTGTSSFSGSGAGYGEAWLPAVMLPSIVSVTVGAGGVFSLQSGGNSFFGNFVMVRGGGQISAGTGFPNPNSTSNIFFNGGVGTSALSGVFYTPRGGCAGGAGAPNSGTVPGGLAGFNTVPTPTGSGANSTGWLVGNAGGVPVSGGDGGDGQSSPVGSIIAGGGGAGGGSANTGLNRGFKGGNGGFPGAGSGAGGNHPTRPGFNGIGGNGTVIVTTFF